MARGNQADRHLVGAGQWASAFYILKYDLHYYHRNLELERSHFTDKDTEVREDCSGAKRETKGEK